MRVAICFLIGLLFVLGSMKPGMAEEPAQVPTISQELVVVKPRQGEALQGIVVIEGRARGEGLQSVKLMFKHSSPDQGGWFYLSAVELGGGASSQRSFRWEWDTTKITDGNYTLRAVARYADGEQVGAIIPDLRIRNYSPIETETPRPQGTTTPTLRASSASAEVDVLSPTPFPPNPAALEGHEISGALMKGLGIVSGLFALYGLYLWASRTSR